MRQGVERKRQVEPIHTASLVEQVADKVVRGIASGHIPRGGRIIESDLANDFGISRIPLREAMMMLEAQGILVAEPRRGRRVAEFDQAQMHEISVARLAIERNAVQQARVVYRASAFEAARLDDAVVALERTAAGPDFDATQINVYDLAIHTEIYRASGNRYLQTMWTAIAKHVMIAFSVEQIFHRLSPSDNLNQHQHLRDILLYGSEDDLDKEIVAHIMSYGRGFSELATQVPREAKRK
jgi:DNA-binding GntR family transcriptional regulator